MEFTDLVELGKRYALKTRENPQALPGLSIYQRDAPSQIEAVVYQPVMCLILQGAKETSIGDRTVELNVGDALLVSHDLPVNARITKASPGSPYMAAILSLDLGTVRGLYEQLGDALTADETGRSMSVGLADPTWVTPLGRYLGLMDNQLDIEILGPAILREIHYRLLLSPIGGMLRNLLSVDSHASRVAKAIRQIRAEFRAPLAVADLAGIAGMSASSFHDHFKSVTGTTPLQYQKDLRLIEARTLLSTRQRSVSEVSFAVGYESPTHFSRDYSRKFGVPPSRDPVIIGEYARLAS